MTLDHSGRAMLLELQEQYDAPAFQDVPDVTGEDLEHRVRLRVDAACRVKEVTVLDLDRLRFPDDLASAVVGSFDDADAKRVLASLEASGAWADYEREGTALLEGRVRLRRTREELRGRDAAPTHRPGALAPAEPDRHGRADNGYLAVTVSGSGRPVRVDVDADYLLGATPARLEDAVEQAFRAADASVSEAVRMTLRADLERFPQAASNWEHITSVLQQTHDLISGTTNQGWRFGILAEGSIDDAFDGLATSMTGALAGGVHATTVMSETLHHVGNLFGLTDQEQSRLITKHRIDLEEDA